MEVAQAIDPLDALAAQHGAVAPPPPAAAAVDPLDALAASHGGKVQVPMNRAVVNGQEINLDDSPLARGAEAFYENSPIGAAVTAVKGAAHVVAHPLDTYFGLVPLADTVKALAKSHWDQAVEAAAKAKAAAVAAKGGHGTEAALSASEAFGHGLAAILPVIGPAAAALGERGAQGDIAGMVGGAAGLLTPAALSAARAKVGVPAIAKNGNPVETAAVDFGRAHDVPIDAATATGNPAIAATQKISANLPGGTGVIKKFRDAQDAALERVGGELAAQSNATAAGPGVPTLSLDAGAHVKAALDQRLADLSTVADQAYGRFHQIADQKGITVNLKPVKDALRPTFDQLAEENKYVPFQDGTGKATAYRALSKIMASPDAAPARIAESVLGELKEGARGARIPALRSEGQGTFALGVTTLSDAVKDAVTRQGGPAAMQALVEGRKATATKWEIADVAEPLVASNEPQKIFKTLTANKDTAITRLRAVAAEAPDVMPHLGRALLEEMLDTATAEGTFSHADKLWKDWRNLGAETKKQLYGAALTTDLDHFFLLAKAIAKNPNPSGTALVASTGTGLVSLLASPALAGKLIPSNYALAKLLTSPTGVRALTKGAMVSLAGKSATPMAIQAARAAIEKALADSEAKQQEPQK